VHVSHPDPRLLIAFVFEGKKKQMRLTTTYYREFRQLSFVFYEQMLANPSIMFYTNIFHAIRLN